MNLIEAVAHRISPTDRFIRRARELAPELGSIAGRNPNTNHQDIDIVFILGRRKNLDFTVTRVQHITMGSWEYYMENQTEVTKDQTLKHEMTCLDFEPNIPIAYTEPSTSEVPFEPRIARELVQVLDKTQFFDESSEEFQALYAQAGFARNIVRERIKRELKKYGKKGGDIFLL